MANNKRPSSTSSNVNNLQIIMKRNECMSPSSSLTHPSGTTNKQESNNMWDPHPSIPVNQFSIDSFSAWAPVHVCSLRIRRHSNQSDEYSGLPYTRYNPILLAPGVIHSLVHSSTKCRLHDIHPKTKCQGCDSNSQWVGSAAAAGPKLCWPLLFPCFGIKCDVDLNNGDSMEQLK